MNTAARRIGRLVLVTVLFLAALTGVTALGMTTTMSQSFPAPPPGSAGQGWSAPPTVPADRKTVAVVVGDTGSVATDVLVPYEVFARSPEFFVYTVGRTRDPKALSGGLHLVPDRTFAETAPAPDVVVVPAVASPTGNAEAPMRDWVAAQAAAGSRVLGVCAGTEVLAAGGLLEGREATSHWSAVDTLERSYPNTRWVRGQRYVQDGPITTTAGVTSGAAGALEMIAQLAGEPEEARVGAELAYPGWSPTGGTSIPVHRREVSDLPFFLNAVFPWGRPTVAVGLTDGIGEIEAAAAADVYNGASFAARTIALGATPTITTRHGVLLTVQQAGPSTPPVDRVLAPGGNDVDPRLTDWATARGLTVDQPARGSTGFGFDPLLDDLAATGDRATAVAAAQYAEYPTTHLDLTGPAWPWRPTALLAATAAAASGLAALTATAAGVLVRRRHEGKHRR